MAGDSIWNDLHVGTAFRGRGPSRISTAEIKRLPLNSITAIHLERSRPRLPIFGGWRQADGTPWR